MRTYLTVAPTWVATLVDALFSIIAMTVFYMAADHSSWLYAVGFACFIAVLTAPFMWRSARRRQRDREQVTGPLSRPQQQAVVQSASTGKPPADPALLGVSLSLARYDFDTALRNRTGSLLAYLAVIGVEVGFAVADHSWVCVGGAAIMAAGFLVVLGYPRWQERRIERLAAATSEGSTDPERVRDRAR